MAQEKQEKTREQILQEIQLNHVQRHARANQLLASIKQHREYIERVLATFRHEEPGLVYRYYHQSYKFFIMVGLLRQALDLFRRLDPISSELNEWYKLLATEALSKEFDWNRTNAIWFAETLPVLQGYWHSIYFLERMLVAADEFKTAPEILPSGWAAVLYLYNLR